jgi:Super-infection exclusion protein B
MGTLKTLVDALVKVYHESPRFMCVICIICAALLFLPHSIVAALSMESIVDKYRPWIGLAFTFSFLMAVSYPVQIGWEWGARVTKGKFYRRRRIARLHTLDSEEKVVLNSYIDRNARALYFQFDNGTVANLILYGFLFRPNRYANMRGANPTVIMDWVWDYLHQHPELVRDE